MLVNCHTVTLSFSLKPGSELMLLRFYVTSILMSIEISDIYVHVLCHKDYSGNITNEDFLYYNSFIFLFHLFTTKYRQIGKTEITEFP